VLKTSVRAADRGKWVPVTMAWLVLMLRLEEWPPIWRVAMNILNKQSWAADKVWSSRLGGCGPGLML